MIQAAEAVEYHENLEKISDRFDRWMTDAENQLEKHTSTTEMKSDYAIDEHYRSVEVCRDNKKEGADVNRYKRKCA